MKGVLIIEDDIWLAKQWATKCQADGFEVAVTRDGFEAIDAIDNRRPDVVVLDISLPGPNGIAFLHELRSHADLAHIPVIVATSHVLEEKNLQPYGVVRILNKQEMTPPEFIGALRKVLT